MSFLSRGEEKLVHITPFMFNHRFHLAKRPLRQDVAACIAFWRIETTKTGHLLPESLQRSGRNFLLTWVSFLLEARSAGNWVIE